MLLRAISSLRPFAKRALRRLGFIGIASTVAGLLEGIALVIVLAVAADATGGATGSDVTLPVLEDVLEPRTALTWAFLCAIAMALAHISVGWSTAKLSTDVAASARDQTLEAFLCATWEAQSERAEGELQENLSTLTLQSSALSLYVANAIAALLALASLLVASFVVNPVAAAVVLSFGLVSVALIRPVTGRIRKGAQRFVAVNGEFEAEATQLARLASEIRTFGVAGVILSRTKRSNSEVAAILRSTRFASRLGSTIYRDVAILFLIGGVAVISTLDADSAISLGVVIILIVRALAYATNFQTARQQVAEHLPSTVELARRLSALNEARHRTGTARPDRLGRLELRGVGYHYPDGRVGASEISLVIEPGLVVGLSGPSGGGKSTLIQLLLRLRLPSDGDVLVDGLDYRSIAEEVWSQRVSLVPQEPQLVVGTIAENISFYRPGISASAIDEAVRLASLEADVARFPAGLDTVLGPRGAGLSGGQRQRVVIARALAAGPDLLILDEPTSALDADAESVIRQTIDDLRGKMTIVLAAHRPETLNACDVQYHVQDGRVSRLGI